MDKPINLDETKFDYNFWTKIGESANSLEIKKRNAKTESQFTTNRNGSYENEQLALVNDLLQDLINNVINLVESSLEYDGVESQNTSNYSKKTNNNHQTDADLIRSKCTKKSDLLRASQDFLTYKQREDQKHLIKTLLEDISILKSNESSILETSTDNNCSFVNAALSEQQCIDNRFYSKSINEPIKKESLSQTQNDNKFLMNDNNRFNSHLKQSSGDLKANCVNSDENKDKNSTYLHLNENKTNTEKNSNDSPYSTHELNRRSDEQVTNSVINIENVKNELSCFFDRRAIKYDNEQTDNMNNNSNIIISYDASNQIEKQNQMVEKEDNTQFNRESVTSEEFQMKAKNTQPLKSLSSSQFRSNNSSLNASFDELQIEKTTNNYTSDDCIEMINASNSKNNQLLDESEPKTNNTCNSSQTTTTTNTNISNELNEVTSRDEHGFECLTRDNRDCNGKYNNNNNNDQNNKFVNSNVNIDESTEERNFNATNNKCEINCETNMVESRKYLNNLCEKKASCIKSNLDLFNEQRKEGLCEVELRKSESEKERESEYRRIENNEKIGETKSQIKLNSNLPIKLEQNHDSNANSKREEMSDNLQHNIQPFDLNTTKVNSENFEIFDNEEREEKTNVLNETRQQEKEDLETNIKEESTSLNTESNSYENSNRNQLENSRINNNNNNNIDYNVDYEENEKHENPLDDKTMSKENRKNSNNSLRNNQDQNNKDQVKKVILNNKEIVLIENCSDEDDEATCLTSNTELKDSELTEICPNGQSTPRNKYHETKSANTTLSGSMEKKQFNKTDDDPFVKAALERFDAFFKSKSTHNLEQEQSKPKSPFLSRKVVPDESEVRKNATSFIKRRQIRIDPTDKANFYDNKTSSKEVQQSEMNNEVCENVGESNNQESSSKCFLTSSTLAKKFLGSLTPQLQSLDTYEDETGKFDDLYTKSETEMKVVDQVAKLHTANSTKETKKSEPLFLSKTKSKSCKNINELNGKKANSSSSENSTTSSPTHSAKTNVIKLELVNGNKAKTKPPLPPNGSTNGQNTLRSSKVKCSQTTSSQSAKSTSTTTESSEKKEKTSDGEKQPAKTKTKVAEQASSSTKASKLISRIIPLELKNSSTSKKAENETSNSPRSKETTTVENQSEEKHTEESFGVGDSQQTTRQDNNESNESKSNYVSSSSFSANDLIKRPYRSNTSFNFYDRHQLPKETQVSYFKTDMDFDYSNESLRPDPVAEKACNNFMFRLMEYQRQNRIYSQPISSPIRQINYTQPFVTARTVNCIQPTPLSAECSFYQHTSDYEPTYIRETTYSTPNEFTHETMDKSECENSHRPYVSSIRKRRTLLSHEIANSCEAKYEDTAYNHYYNNSSGYLSARREISREISNNSPYFSSDYSHSLKANDEENITTPTTTTTTTTASTTNALPESNNKETLPSRIKKSSSLNYNKPAETQEASKVTNVFSRLSSFQNSASDSVKKKLNPSTSVSDMEKFESSTTNNNNLRETKNKNTETNKNIKLQNEIAIVTSLTPAKSRDKSVSKALNSTLNTSTTNSTSSATLSTGNNVSRLRSLDCRNRDKFKSNSLKKNTSTTKSSRSPSPKTDNSTSTISTYLYGAQTDGKVASKPNQAHASMTSKSTTSFDFEVSSLTTNNNSKHHHQQQQQQQLQSQRQQQRTDVFERLSKRTSSMKNLLNKKQFNTSSIENDANKESNSSSSASSSLSNDEYSHNDDIFGGVNSNTTTCNTNKNESNLNSTLAKPKLTNSSTKANKTSVFERLYKSNIAAHMNNNNNSNNISNDYSRLNKAVSSANLASNNAFNLSSPSCLQNRKVSNQSTHLARQISATNNNSKLKKNLSHITKSTSKIDTFDMSTNHAEHLMTSSTSSASSELIDSDQNNQESNSLFKVNKDEKLEEQSTRMLSPREFSSSFLTKKLVNYLN